MCDRDALTQPVIEQGSVWQTGQRIVKGLIFERILLSPLLGYVVHDPYEASLAAEEHFAGAEFHGKDRAIFPLSPQLTGTRDRDRALARPQIIAEVAHKVIAVRFSHEDLRILPLHLSQRVAEEPLRRAIENLDQAALVDGDDPIGNVVQNSPDKLRTFLQGSLYPRPFNELPDLASDVGHCRKEPLIRLEDLPAVEIDHPGRCSSVQDRDAKGSVQPRPNGSCRCRQVGILRDVDDPQRCTVGQYPARQVEFVKSAGFQADLGRLGDFWRGGMPGVT